MNQSINQSYFKFHGALYGFVAKKEEKKSGGGAVFRYYTVTALTIGNDGNLETQ